MPAGQIAGVPRPPPAELRAAEPATVLQGTTFDRFQKLIGNQEIHKVKIDKDDLNRKFLRSLGSEWNVYTVT